MRKYKDIISNLPTSRVKDYRFDDEDDDLVQKVIELYYGAISDKMSDDEDFKTITLLYLGSFRPLRSKAKILLENDEEYPEEYNKVLRNVLKYPDKFNGYKSTLYASPDDGGDE